MNRSKVLLTGAIIFFSMFIGTSHAEYQGSYHTQRLSLETKLEITLNPAGYYNLQWDLGDPGGIFTGAGFEAFGYLAAAELGNDMIAVFRGQDSELDGLWASIDRLEIVPECTENAEELQFADTDISGTYLVTGKNDLTQHSFSYTITLEHYKLIWEVTRKVEALPLQYGVGMMVDDMVLIGFWNEGKKNVLLFKAGEEKMVGKWMIYWFDGYEMVVTGSAEAEKIEEKRRKEKEKQ